MMYEKYIVLGKKVKRYPNVNYAVGDEIHLTTGYKVEGIKEYLYINDKHSMREQILVLREFIKNDGKPLTKEVNIQMSKGIREQIEEMNALKYENLKIKTIKEVLSKLH